jgi:hypothetical protein
VEQIVGRRRGAVVERQARAAAPGERARPGFAERHVAVGDHRLRVAEAPREPAARLAADAPIAFGRDTRHHGRHHHRAEPRTEAVLVRPDPEASQLRRRCLGRCHGP